jgi:hypothetical protein
MCSAPRPWEAFYVERREDGFGEFLDGGLTVAEEQVVVAVYNYVLSCESDVNTACETS